AELSPIIIRPSITIPPPNPVPSVKPSRLPNRRSLPAAASRWLTCGNRPPSASPYANSAPSLLMNAGRPNAAASIGPSGTPPRHALAIGPAPSWAPRCESYGARGDIRSRRRGLRGDVLMSRADLKAPGRRREHRVSCSGHADQRNEPLHGPDQRPRRLAGVL